MSYSCSILPLFNLLVYPFFFHVAVKFEIAGIHTVAVGASQLQ